MKLEISLSPTGDFRLHLPPKVIGGVERDRTLDITANENGVTFLQKVLRDAASGRRDQPGYIGSFPTQAVIDAWALEARKRRVEESIAEASERLGVDISKLEIDL